MKMDLVDAAAQIRSEFFELLWGKREGYAMIASQTEADRIARNHKGWREKAFLWPDESSRMLKYIDSEEHGRHVWFTPLLYDKPHRGKDDVSVTDIVWADLDECHPDSITPSAPIVIQSSPGRYQAIWKLDIEDDNTIPAGLASEYSSRVAYKYRDQGADVSGADLAQLLRVPGTHNYKREYVDDSGSPPPVTLLTFRNVIVPVRIFDSLPEVPGADYKFEELPDILDADKVIGKYNKKLSKAWHEAYTVAPEQDWSKKLWRFLQQSFEAGMNKQEVFSVAVGSACNKFKRDGYRPNLSLWNDVLRAHTKYEALRSTLTRFATPAIDLPPLYDATELSDYDSFIDRYYLWASSLGDAANQYHELSAFIILSAVLGGNIKIESSIGDIIPNIWGMILADTTITRKTTAMNHATELLESVPGCEDVVLGTDGSMEGVFKAMSKRAGKPSIFYKDEVQGFISSVGKKDYMSGMLEGFTKLYDGKNLRRQLAKEAISVINPVFIVYAGGIKTKMFSVLTAEHIESGFLPRFLFVTAEGDVDKMQPLGRRTEAFREAQGKLRHELSKLRDTYVTPAMVGTGIGNTVIATHPQVVADLTDEAWDRYNLFEKTLMIAGNKSQDPATHMPMLARFSTSTLKCAVLLAAQRQIPQGEKLTVELKDVVKAISHTTNWLPSMLEVVANLGKTAFEGDVQKVWKFIKEHDGTPKGAVMRNYKLSAREMANILDTLEGRGLIDIRHEGKARFLYTIGE